MQTHFSLAQLANPDLAEADKILRACVHCGFCTATCPTYVLLGDELDSPRGRIYLIKEMLEADRPAGHVEALHLDRCLSCLSCMTTCPSGVDYMHLVDIGRARVAETYSRPLVDRALRWHLSVLLPNPFLFRLSILGARLVRLLGLRALLPRQAQAMLDLAPASLPPRAPTDGPGTFLAEGVARGRVGLLPGCAQQVLDPGINQAAIRLLNRLGIEVAIPEGLGCCGALTHHMGLTGDSHAKAKASIAAWMSEIERRGLDAIVITASGCGTTIKDYGYLFRSDPEWRDPAAKVSSLACDIAEYLARPGKFLGRLPVLPEATPRPRIAYHAACSLQHGQGLLDPPIRLLEQAGFSVMAVPEGHLCCGSAGTYNMLQPDLSRSLRDRKAGHINGLGCDAVATGNIGCMRQLAPVLKAPILHLVELLDWATGGPRPVALEK